MKSLIFGTIKQTALLEYIIYILLEIYIINYACRVYSYVASIYTIYCILKNAWVILSKLAV